MAGATDSENSWEIEIDSFGPGYHLLKHPESGLGWFLASGDVLALLDKKPRYTILCELCKAMPVEQVRQIVAPKGEYGGRDAAAVHATTHDLQTLLERVTQRPATTA